MGYSKQIAEAVREAYENKRKKAEADLEARRAEMYEKARNCAKSTVRCR